MKHCCEMMEENVEFKCEQHKSQFDCPDSLIYYSEKTHHYGIIIHDGGPSFIIIRYCPWCGTKLKD